MDFLHREWSTRDEHERARILSSLAGGVVVGALGGSHGVGVVGLGLAALAWQHAQQQQQQQVQVQVDPLVVGAGVAGGVVGASLGSTGLLLLVGTAAYGTTTLPANETFAGFFEAWFQRDFYPKLQRKLQAELEERTRNPNASVFEFLKDAASNVMFQATQRLQEMLAWEAVKAQVLPKTVFRNYQVFKTATVDLGSSSNPCHYTFVGFGNQWSLAPWLKVDLSDVNVLRLLDSGSSSHRD